MQCQKCKNLKSWCIDSRKGKNKHIILGKMLRFELSHTRRRYKCDKCGFAFTTYEFYEEEISKTFGLDNLKLKLKSISKEISLLLK